MNSQIEEIVEVLEMILEDSLPYKVDTKLTEIVRDLKKEELPSDTLMRIQDDLEMISATSNLDDFSRNEIINVVTLIETIYNS